MPNHRLRVVLPTSLLFLFGSSLAAQGASGVVPADLLETLEWRLVGPFRGGRSCAVAGDASERDTYWFGACGGGVWKTTDGGKTWRNMSDGFFGGSIGAVATAPSDPDVVWVGGGENTWRGNMSPGDGVWKTTDGGAHWEFAGLPESQFVGRIRIHPEDPERVYVAVMGHGFGPSEERGVYRTTDGGATWERVLFVDPQVGAFDLCLASGDPDTIYATTWRSRRTPHSLESGGEGSGLWKSADGGDTWESLVGRPGLPKGLLGICGIAVAPSDDDVVYAQIESENGGLFRSDDGGETWEKVNDERKLRQRAWYYSHVYVDPKDADTVYCLNVGMHKSTDGGRTFTRVATPHGDNHDLWIDPGDPRRMIEGNDGGACVSTDGGKHWSSLRNQPTAQFYRVTVDEAAPFRIYGAQQDNSAVRIAHRSRGRGIGEKDWESTAGGESGWLAPRPDDPEIVFGGSYGGYLQRRDHRTGLGRSVDVWPDNPLGAGAGEQRYRFQWNFPIQWSRHRPGVLFAAAQVLFRTEDEGQTWQAISPDLTRDDESRQGPSGGPITKDNSGVEYYCTIFAFDEGRVPGTLWCGSDDGLVHVSRDEGETWRDVTPPALPEWAQINCIAHDPHRDGGCYVAATCYKLDDFRPYLFVTEDYGESWRAITGGLDPRWFTRTIRPDPEVDGLLYCGTERTVWVSFDRGRRWQKMAPGLPPVPITDLIVKDGHLVAATQGRSFWAFDALAHVRQLEADQAQVDLHVYEPVPLVQYPGGDQERPGLGRNPCGKIQVRFWLGGESDEEIGEPVAVTVSGIDGDVVFSRRTDAEEEEDRLEVHPGMNVVTVDWKEEKPFVIDGMVLWSGRGSAPRFPPGDYGVKVSRGDEEIEVVATVLPDPRTTATVDELQDRYRLAVRCRDTVTKAHRAVEHIRSLREQMKEVVGRADEKARDPLRASREKVDAALTEVEEALYQTKARSSQDVLNFPIRLTDKLMHVMRAVDHAEFGPTEGQRQVVASLIQAIDVQLGRYDDVLAKDVAEFNALAARLAVPHVR